MTLFLQSILNFKFQSPSEFVFYILNQCELSLIDTNIYFFFYRLIGGPKGLELPHLTSKKLTDAGFEFKHSIEEMFEDAIQSCKEKGLF